MTRPGPVLIARDAVLAALEQHLLRVGEHGPGLVLLTGPAGVGRTAVVEHLLARHDGRALRARGAAWETDRRFAVLDQLLSGAEIPSDPFGAAELLVRRAGGAPGRPALVLVDDAHWSDRDSLQVLSSVVRHQHDAAVLIILTAPSGDPTVPSETLDLLRRSATAVVQLSPLTPTEVGELAAAKGVVLHPSMAERLCAHTGGVAQHVVALIDELPRATWARFDPVLPPPVAVASWVRSRLAGVSPATRALVEAVAVLKGPTPLRDVAALAQVDDVLTTWEEAQQAGLVTEVEPRALVPTSPMVRAAVLASMGPVAAAEAHRRAADLAEDPATRLQHLVAATPTPDCELAEQLDALAVRQAADGAWAVAAALLTDASRLTEERDLRDRRLVRAVDALIGAGDGHGAAAMVPEVESLRETPLRNAVLGYLAIIRGRVTEAETRLRRAWDLVNLDREPEVGALICQRYVLHLLSRCRGAELVEWADRAVELVGPDHPVAVEAQAIRGLGLAGAGRPAEGLADYHALVDRVRHGAQGQRVVMGKGWLQLVLDEVDDARVELERAVPTTFLGGSTRISLWARAWLARIQFLTGEWEHALRTVQDGLAVVERTGMVLASPLLQWTAVQVHALRGDWDLAQEAVRSLGAGAQDYEIMRVPAHLAQAAVAEAQADYHGVLRALAPLTQSWARGTTVDEPGFWPWPDVYANALVQAGKYDEADAFLTPHEQVARKRRHRSAQARLGYARGRLLGARGDLDGVGSVFRTSLDLLEDLPLRYDRARVNFAFGQTLRRAGKRREADAVISSARDLFLALGASTYVRRCDRELKAGGLKLARGDRGFADLTPQEEAVAGLVARGLSNREVAAELYLSMKTVQYHLTRIYAKLGIRSRAELAALRGPATSGADSM